MEYLALGVIALGICCLGAILLFELDRMNTTLRFIEEKKNILLVGSSGVGKTHIATAVSIEAAKKRISTYFISCHDLITKLNTAHQENRLKDALKTFNKYKLLMKIPLFKNFRNENIIFFKFINSLIQIFDTNLFTLNIISFIFK